MSTLGDRRLLLQSYLALLLANARYWPTVAPHVRVQLGRYENSARAIRDPALQALALDKLEDQGFHAQVAATLATLAPRSRRASATRAIVAIEVMYDYLDGLTEQRIPNPLDAGRRLAQAFTDAVSIDRTPTGDYYTLYPHSDDRGYLQALVGEARDALAQLPSADTIAETARRCAVRFAEAQIRAHAIPLLGRAQLEEWATGQAVGTELGWLEYFAGATSTVLGLHAMIAAAADPRTTASDAAQIDSLYLYIGVIVTMLDSVIDHERDVASTGQPGYTRYYEDHDQLLQGLTNATRHVLTNARAVPHTAHHVMTLAGVVAFYTTAPTASSDAAAEVAQHLQRELQPLITPTLAVMRSWRKAKQLRRWWETNRQRRLRSKATR